MLYVLFVRTSSPLMASGANEKKKKKKTPNETEKKKKEIYTKTFRRQPRAGWRIFFQSR